MAEVASSDVTRARRQRVDAARLALLERAPSSTLKDLLTATLDLAEGLTGSQIGFLHFVEDDQTTLWLQAWSTNTTARMCTAEGAGSHYPIQAAGVWADCVRTRKPVVHNDYASLPDKKGMPDGHATVVRELTVPVVRAGRAVAVLGVGNKPLDYDDWDVEDVATLADLAWDIAAWKRAEESARASAAYARSLIEASLDPLVTVSPEGKITDVNAATEAATGIPRDRLIGTDFADYFTEPEKARAGYQQVLARHSVSDYPLTIRHVSGRTTQVLYNATVYTGQGGKLEGVFAAARDVTQLRALQAELSLASRQTALGTLAGGVAHQVNNPLAAVLGDVDLALHVIQDIRDQLDKNTELRGRVAKVHRLDEVIEGLSDAQKGARRIERIVKELKVFATPRLERAEVRLAEVAEKALRWLPASVHKVATVKLEDGGAPPVRASFGQIEQVVVHLITNAANATRPGQPNLIIVRTGPGSAGMARLEVVDQGTGIEPAVLQRIFEPFFTTAEVGKGMGLGLAVCHSIVGAYGGTLTVESQVGVGSTFRLELPEGA
jgi:two-component system, cell cycle sensor histidine kinase and response regulator CckA